jgi:hypothetical protein
MHSWSSGLLIWCRLCVKRLWGTWKSWMFKESERRYGSSKHSQCSICTIRVLLSHFPTLNRKTVYRIIMSLCPWPLPPTLSQWHFNHMTEFMKYGMYIICYWLNYPCVKIVCASSPLYYLSLLRCVTWLFDYLSILFQLERLYQCLTETETCCLLWWGSNLPCNHWGNNAACFPYMWHCFSY